MKKVGKLLTVLLILISSAMVLISCSDSSENQFAEGTTTLKLARPKTKALEGELQDIELSSCKWYYKISQSDPSKLTYSNTGTKCNDGSYTGSFGQSNEVEFTLSYGTWTFEIWAYTKKTHSAEDIIHTTGSDWDTVSTDNPCTDTNLEDYNEYYEVYRGTRTVKIASDFVNGTTVAIAVQKDDTENYGLLSVGDISITTIFNGEESIVSEPNFTVSVYDSSIYNAEDPENGLICKYSKAELTSGTDKAIALPADREYVALFDFVDTAFEYGETTTSAGVFTAEIIFTLYPNWTYEVSGSYDIDKLKKLTITYADGNLVKRVEDFLTISASDIYIPETSADYAETIDGKEMLSAEYREEIERILNTAAVDIREILDTVLNLEGTNGTYDISNSQDLTAAIESCMIKFADSLNDILNLVIDFTGLDLSKVDFKDLSGSLEDITNDITNNLPDNLADWNNLLTFVSEVLDAFNSAFNKSYLEDFDVTGLLTIDFSDFAIGPLFNIEDLKYEFNNGTTTLSYNYWSPFFCIPVEDKVARTITLDDYWDKADENLKDLREVVDTIIKVSIKDELTSKKTGDLGINITLSLEDIVDTIFSLIEDNEHLKHFTSYLYELVFGTLKDVVSNHFQSVKSEYYNAVSTGNGMSDGFYEQILERLGYEKEDILDEYEKISKALADKNVTSTSDSTYKKVFEELALNITSDNDVLEAFYNLYSNDNALYFKAALNSLLDDWSRNREKLVEKYQGYAATTTLASYSDLFEELMDFYNKYNVDDYKTYTDFIEQIAYNSNHSLNWARYYFASELYGFNLDYALTYEVIAQIGMCSDTDLYLFFTSYSDAFTSVSDYKVEDDSINAFTDLYNKVKDWTTATCIKDLGGFASETFNETSYTDFYNLVSGTSVSTPSDAICTAFEVTKTNRRTATDYLGLTSDTTLDQLVSIYTSMSDIIENDYVSKYQQFVRDYIGYESLIKLVTESGSKFASITHTDCQGNTVKTFTEETSYTDILAFYEAYQRSFYSDSIAEYFYAANPDTVEDFVAFLEYWSRVDDLIDAVNEALDACKTTVSDYVPTYTDAGVIKHSISQWTRADLYGFFYSLDLVEKEITITGSTPDTEAEQKHKICSLLFDDYSKVEDLIDFYEATGKLSLVRLEQNQLVDTVKDHSFNTETTFDELVDWYYEMLIEGYVYNLDNAISNWLFGGTSFNNEEYYPEHYQMIRLYSGLWLEMTRGLLLSTPSGAMFLAAGVDFDFSNGILEVIENSLYGYLSSWSIYGYGLEINVVANDLSFIHTKNADEITGNSYQYAGDDTFKLVFNGTGKFSTLNDNLDAHLDLDDLSVALQGTDFNLVFSSGEVDFDLIWDDEFASSGKYNRYANTDIDSFFRDLNIELSKMEDALIAFEGTYLTGGISFNDMEFGVKTTTLRRAVDSANNYSDSDYFITDEDYEAICEYLEKRADFEDSTAWYEEKLKQWNESAKDYKNKYSSWTDDFTAYKAERVTYYASATDYLKDFTTWTNQMYISYTDVLKKEYMSGSDFLDDNCKNIYQEYESRANYYKGALLTWKTNYEAQLSLLKNWIDNVATTYTDESFTLTSVAALPTATTYSLKGLLCTENLDYLDYDTMPTVLRNGLTKTISAMPVVTAAPTNVSVTEEPEWPLNTTATELLKQYWCFDVETDDGDYKYVGVYLTSDYDRLQVSVYKLAGNIVASIGNGDARIATIFSLDTDGDDKAGLLFDEELIESIIYPSTSSINSLGKSNNFIDSVVTRVHFVTEEESGKIVLREDNIDGTKHPALKLLLWNKESGNEKKYIAIDGSSLLNCFNFNDEYVPYLTSALTNGDLATACAITRDGLFKNSYIDTVLIDYVTSGIEGLSPLYHVGYEVVKLLFSSQD